jgi:hypothetical protein
MAKAGRSLQIAEVEDHPPRREASPSGAVAAWQKWAPILRMSAVYEENHTDPKPKQPGISAFVACAIQTGALASRC